MRGEGGTNVHVRTVSLQAPGAQQPRAARANYRNTQLPPVTSRPLARHPLEQEQRARLTAWLRTPSSNRLPGASCARAVPCIQWQRTAPRGTLSQSVNYEAQATIHVHAGRVDKRIGHGRTAVARQREPRDTRDTPVELPSGRRRDNTGQMP